jgi:ribonucleoside-diphosphate reductase alpha chain
VPQTVTEDSAPVAVTPTATTTAAEDLEQIDMFSGTPTENIDPLVGDTVEAFLSTSTTSVTSAVAVSVTETQTTFANQEDAPPCSNCGSITVRSGACYSCPNCGATSGCG